MWTCSGVVLPILTMASVMAAVISRFCCGVRPAYHCTVMLGMAGLLLLEALHVGGKVGGEGVGLDGAVRVEPHREVLGLLRTPAALTEEPAPGRVAAVDADLIGLAVEALQFTLARLAHGDGAGLGRGKLPSIGRREASGGERGYEERSRQERRTHGPIITRAVPRGQTTPRLDRAPRGTRARIPPWRRTLPRSRPPSRRTSPISTGRSLLSSTSPKWSRARCSPATRARPSRSADFSSTSSSSRRRRAPRRAWARRGRSGSTSACSRNTATTPWPSSAACTSPARARPIS